MNPKAAMLNVLYLLVTSTHSAHILGVVPTPSYSHQIVFQPLWRELSLRGHKLTVLTTDPINDASLTNLTEIDLHESYAIVDNINFVETSQINIIQVVNIALTLGKQIMEKQFSHPDVQALIQNKSLHFDLLVVEGVWLPATVFSERFQCPFIQIASVDATTYAHSSLGNPTHPVLNPDFQLAVSEKLTFVERLTSVLFRAFLNYYYHVYVYPTSNSFVKQYFGDGYSDLQDIVTNVSMLFVYTDQILHRIRPLVPTVVQIGGGLHFKPSQPLPNYLQQYLDHASDGFIYFSLGTNVKAKHLSQNSINILLETFADLPYKVLWKFELEELPGKPENVIISKWFPQQDILRHRHIKLFITQGGLQSMEETIYSHVPFVGIPFIPDQKSNVHRMVSKGLGLSVDYTTMDKVSLKNTILEVIDNPRYREKVKELAELARDQPMTGLERAVYWTEYVIRHKGAKHLRSPAIDLPFYQYLLLDVIAFCLLVFLLAIYVLLKLLKLSVKCFKYCRLKPKTKVH